MGANKPVAPASLLQVGGAGRVVGKKSLELWERLWEPKIATLVNVHEHGRTLPLVAVGDNRIGKDQSLVHCSKADGTASSITVPSTLYSALASGIQTSLVSDSTSGKIGEIGWNFGVQDLNFDFLAVGETLTFSYDVSVMDNNGVSSAQPVTFTITGTDDVPVTDAAHSTLAGAINELPNLTGSSGVDSTSGVIAFSDPDLNDRPTATIDTAGQTATWQDGSSHVFALSAAQVAMFDQAIQITPDAGNTNTGKIDWSFGLVDKLIDFLGGETVTVTTPVIIDDHQGGTANQNVIVTVNGANDNPIAVPDNNGVAKGATLSVAASTGVLANDADPDVHDQGHSVVSAVNGSAASVGHAVQGTYGSLTLNADGSYVYAANTFNYTVSDLHDGTGTSNLSIVVFNPDANYLSAMNTSLNGGNGKNVLDGSAGGDVLIGGNGADVLIGGNGDKLTGGNGPDTFMLRPNFGTNTITDFDIKNGVI